MRKAFTLAEVLITLGIIGIVATLTIPGLIANYKKKETVTRLKKAYSTMAQAIQLSEVDNGDAASWSYPPFRDFDKTEEFVNQYILPYFKYLKAEKGNYAGIDITLVDGSSFEITMGGCIDILYDINGDSKAPNQFGRDMFHILLCGDGKVQPYYGLANSNSTREELLAACQENGQWCVGLIMHDGWEFKDDYPWKI
jgi:prepilin-type N-terminal cleavage/methylation domain-containing protein